jgi:predicted O-linked N-acetylglucosamine transferase (SPINDLY family)
MMAVALTKDKIPQALQAALGHFRAGEAAQVEAICRQILETDPRQAKAMHILGLLYLQTNHPDASAQMLSQAAALMPQDYSVHHDLGNALLVLRQLDAAMAAYRRVIAMSPNSAPAHCNLGIALSESGRNPEALACFERAIALAPNQPDNHNNFGNALRNAGRLDEAIAAFQKALALRPDWPDVLNNLGNTLKDCGQIPQAIAATRKAVQLKPNFVSANSNLVMFLHFDQTCDAKAIFEEHRRWNQAHAAPLGGQIAAHANDRNPGRRLRGGYISSDFRDHAVNSFFEPLLSSHDPAQVESFCYANIPRADHVTERLQKQASQWRGIAGQTDEQVAQQVRADQIDILVDLAGHTAGNRLLVMARRPAPIQVTWLGYPDTSGLDAIDCRFTDALADPPGMTEQFHSEELIRLPQTFLCYQQREDAPQVSAAPVTKNGYITFGSFNIVAKINLAVVALWSKVLQRSPGSKMLIKSGGLDSQTARRWLIELFAASGIGEDRLELRGKVSSQAGHLQLYERMDIALDTFPYHGTTTTCEALWMGVPVITLAGRSHMSRVGVSLLTNIGLPELIAETPEDFAAIAAKLGDDRLRLSALRAGMRERMLASPLMDADRFARNVESAYREMWRRWCSKSAN